MCVAAFKLITQSLSFSVHVKLFYRIVSHRVISCSTQRSRSDGDNNANRPTQKNFDILSYFSILSYFPIGAAVKRIVYCSVNCCVLKRDKAALSIHLKQKYTVMLLYTFHLHCGISFSGTSLHWSSKLLHQTTLAPEFTAGKLYANVVKQTVDSTTSSSCCNLTFVSTNQNCLQHRISQSQLK